MKKKVFPPAHTGGGLALPYSPTDEEMENCEYAKRANAVCPRKKGERQFVTGGPCPLIDCASCPHHPENQPIRTIDIKVEERPGMSADAVRRRPHRIIGPGGKGMPEDAHERRM